MNVPVNNHDFLTAVFKDDAPFTYVTDFPDDPSNITGDRHRICWSGDWYSRYPLQPNTNQYFTISIFNPDSRGGARRRKDLYLRTRCIVLDDVREKLPIEAANKLPPPSWILETSPGSEQWGYILTEPCHDRARVENLLDGLVSNGLAPKGKDPGMKGVTRFVRLPEGVNTKASKLVNGAPARCQMLEWHPERTVTLEQLAEPFMVNLEASRRETRGDGAGEVPDHPLLQIPDLIHIKSQLGNGRFDITCPWVDEHTDAADNGAAVFTNTDGSMGFKCHHGACEGRTGTHLLKWLEDQEPGFRDQYKIWQLSRAFDTVAPAPPVQQTQEPVQQAQTPPPTAAPSFAATLQEEISKLGQIGLSDTDRAERASKVLKLAEDLGTIEKQQAHSQIFHLMQWSKREGERILKDLRTEWYTTSDNKISFMTEFMYIHDQDKIYDPKTAIFYTVPAFNNAYGDLVDNPSKNALIDGVVTKVHSLQFAPGQPLIFEKRGRKMGNTFRMEKLDYGTAGNIQPWIDQFRIMGIPDDYRDLIMDFMACCIQRPETKINFLILLAGYEGSGKDWLLYPLKTHFNEYYKTVRATTLVDSFQSQLVNTKVLHINEVELMDHKDSNIVSARLKEYAAAPPDEIEVNQKHLAMMYIPNLFNVVMCSNLRTPVKLNGMSRRIFAFWTDLDVRDTHGDIKPEWAQYWSEAWPWMLKGGGSAVVNYLRQRDISHFNPGLPPPVTDFLRDMVQSSKNAIEQTLEDFIKFRFGLLGSDLVSAHDITMTLKAAAMGAFRTSGDIPASHYIHTDATYFTPVSVGKAMGKIPGVIRKRGHSKYEDVNLWVVRNMEKYASMTGTELFDEYARQIEIVRPGNNPAEQNPLRVVN